MPTCESDLTIEDLTLASPSSSTPHARIATGSHISNSLYPFISFAKSYGLNLLPGRDRLEHVLRPLDQKDLVMEIPEDSGGGEPNSAVASNGDTPVDGETSGSESSGTIGGMIESQVEPGEMIIHVQFSELVRIKSILIGTGGGRGDWSPRRCKAWVNRSDGVTFDEASEETSGSRGGRGRGANGPEQEWELLSDESGGRGAVEYPTRIAKFSNVTQVTIYFYDPPSEETSRLYYLGFKGESRTLKKGEGERLTVGAEESVRKMIDGTREKYAASQAPVR